MEIDMKIGVLALQGAFAEHEQMLSLLGVDSVEIRQSKDLNGCFDGIIIPGGESTVQGKLLRDLGIFEPLRDMIIQGMPTFGTCAGLILLAKKVENDSRVHLATMDMCVSRNAYGRQLGSFYTEANFGVCSCDVPVQKVKMTFIRAPYIVSVGDGVDVLARVDGKIVAARQDKQLVTAFHPELTDDLYVHKYFTEIVKEK